MGDARFARAYERIRAAQDRVEAIRHLTDEEVVAALAGASRHNDPLLANVLATETQNRVRRSRTITSYLAEGTFSVDEQLRLTFVNPAMARLLGGDWPDYVGQRVDEVLVIRSADGSPLTGSPACPIRRVLEGEGVVELDGSIARLAHEALPVSLVVGPIVREGRVEGAVAAFRDVTERRRLESALSTTFGSPRRSRAWRRAWRSSRTRGGSWS